MDATTLHTKYMEHTVSLLQKRFPQLSYSESNTFYWSPETKQVFYSPQIKDASSVWSLLHETSHGLLEHCSYRTDLELLRLEMAAWERAKELAAELNIKIDNGHIEDCLDTYRDWLYARSTCPRCGNQSLQQPKFRYKCYNCHTMWKVTPSRFCRTYRNSNFSKGYNIGSSPSPTKVLTTK